MAPYTDIGLKVVGQGLSGCSSLAVKLWLTIEYQSDSAPYQPKIETYPQVYKTQFLNY